MTPKSRVRQVVNLYFPDFDGPESDTAELRSQFLVVGINVDKESESGMDSSMKGALTKAKHLQLEGAEIVVESDDGTQVVGSFSYERGPTRVTNGRFRAIHKK